MLKVGITGGIGSGKSTVCRIFESLGVPVFSADDAGRRLLTEDKEVHKKIIALFGEQIIVNGQPDRKKIAEFVFNDTEKLEQLNAIIHPAVRAAVETWATKQHSSWVIEEAAILFESGAYKTLDAIIVVSAPEDLRIKRVMTRDGVTEASVRERIENQITEEERKQRADFIIYNDDKQMLTPQAIAIFKIFSSGQFAKKN